MIDNVHSQIGQILGAALPPEPGALNKRRQAECDATLQVNSGGLINAAREAEAADADAVRKARALVNAGRLTTLENIRATAQSILAEGI
jgi:hypothetical protein